MARHDGAGFAGLRDPVEIKITDPESPPVELAVPGFSKKLAHRLGREAP